jgi:thioredoxin reductase
MLKSRQSIAVIGGGSLGTLIALQLSNLGLDVEIFESKSELLRGASYLGEGKIHLGYTYGLSQRSTYENLIKAAFNFGEIIQDTLRTTIDWTNLTSIPFTYTVDRNSLITPDEFIQHATNIGKIIKEKNQQTYLGTPASEMINLVRSSESIFLTTERAVDLEKLGLVIVKEVKKRENITVYLNSEISEIEINKSNKYILKSKSTIVEKGFDYVINCTWNKKHFLDQYFLKNLPVLNYRTKLYVSAQTNLREVAFTRILGKFGDLIIFKTGRLYASDYLTGLTSFENSIYPGFSERESLPADLVKKHWEYLKFRFSVEVPELSEIKNIVTLERSVVAEGDSDIDQIESGLHQRTSDYLARKDNYISALATKFTNVPELSKKIVDWISSDGV